MASPVAARRRLPEVRCDDEMLRLHCNLGYAGLGCAGRYAGCMHLPAGGAFDAVRFMVQRESPVVLRVQFACERAHQPALCGELRYDQSLKTWLERPDARLLASGGGSRTSLDRKECQRLGVFTRCIQLNAAN